MTPTQGDVSGVASDDELATMRCSVRGGCSNRPGVYRMLAADGEVLYVGKSRRVRSRLLSYFRCAYPVEKGSRILRQSRRIEWEYTPSEFAALLHELRLIKRLRPRYNVAMKRDARHFALIKLTPAPAPKLMVVRGASEDGSLYYGPFQGATRVSDSLRELNDVLGLRDCALARSMYFADQRELFQITPRTPGCIRHEVRKCLGPCVGACSERQYAERVALARAFLEGDCGPDGPVETLRHQMRESSERLEYERAAALRDKVHRLEALHEQFMRLRFALETLSFVYPVAGFHGDDRVYLIRRGVVRAEQQAPRTAPERRTLNRLVNQIFGAAEHTTARVPTHEIDELLLLSSWFRRFPQELARTRRGAGTATATRRAPRLPC